MAGECNQKWGKQGHVAVAWFGNKRSAIKFMEEKK